MVGRTVIPPPIRTLGCGPKVFCHLSVPAVLALQLCDVVIVTRGCVLTLPTSGKDCRI